MSYLELLLCARPTYVFKPRHFGHWGQSLLWNTLTDDADIRKVLTGFLVTAWATFLAIVVHYATASIDSSSNPLDISLLYTMGTEMESERWLGQANEGGGCKQVV
jgi:hypothetical protein